MRKRLVMRERTLLLYSEVIKQFPDVLKVIEENEDITDELVEGLPDNQRNFFDNLLPRVLKQATSEWRGDQKRLYEDRGPDENNWLRCSLENQPNRHIFYIYNQINGTRLNVGSECIQKFWNGTLEGKTIAQIKHEFNRIKRLGDLNEKLPGIARVIENWNDFLEECPIVIHISLEKPFLDLGRKATALLENYLNGKEQANDYFEDFKQILNEREELVIKITKYVSEKSLDKKVPNKEIRDWLKKNQLFDILEKLKQNGKITWGTACKIEEPNFMKSIVQELNSSLNSIGLNIINVDVDRNGYVLEPTGGYKIRLFSRHKDLVLYCGWILFNDEPYEPLTLEGVLKNCSLYGEEDIYAVLRGLETFASKSEISFEDVDFEYNEVTVLYKRSGQYVLAGLKQLADEFIGLVVGAKDKNVADLVAYISNLPGKRYTKAELKEIRRMREEYNIKKY